jgi:hypothetical protein
VRKTDIPLQNLNIGKHVTTQKPQVIMFIGSYANIKFKNIEKSLQNLYTISE